ncbi:AraC family transcriptional regulator [Aciduricibacillus chroicocephali]|uniref:AraC family transcriptional regulator n=1 Tax=Aciduricibacillus chroicocephali TaxID=3054939 RepID=A0ABY9KUV5_9BACI|nr:AraC family transcriptional regulator [Bacillaceae bacterium 44XB]
MENVLTCEKRNYSREFNAHQHEFGQFLFPLQGSLEIKTKWQEINLNPEHCFYLPPNCEHKYRSVDRNEFLILDIPTQYLPGDTDSMFITMDRQWDSIRYLLMEESESRRNKSSLADLTRYVTSKLETSAPASIAYIHEHYKEAIRLEILAELEHYHPVYYSSWFKKKTGKSLKAYINELRLKEAKHLLHSTGWSMTKISEELGFENPSSFTRWFVNLEEVPPYKYRKLQKG